MAEPEGSANARRFEISQEPRVGSVAGLDETAHAFDIDHPGELPRGYGSDVFVAIARDPHTIFAYWQIDWRNAFAHGGPVDQQAHIRLYHADELVELTQAVELLAQSCYIKVDAADSSYRAEIGFFHPVGQWNSVATSERVLTPADAIGEIGSAHFATVPFHLGFQTIIDSLHRSKPESASLLEVGQDLFEQKVLPNEPIDPALREMALIGTGTLAPEVKETARDKAGAGWNRQQLEVILGFGESNSLCSASEMKHAG